MSGSIAAPPFPLGAYLGNPDNSSLANQALFDTKYNSFTHLMGAAPQYLNYFVDQRKPISQWVGNSTWAADSASQSANAKGAAPVIALPMSSTAPGSLTSQQQFQAFAAGQYDDALRGIVQTWAQRGFTNLTFRPGWEMNIGGPTYAGDSAQSQADWVKAFQHIYTVLHQAATANAATVQVVWNPSVTNYSNALATTNLYPGDAYVDVIGADMYSDIYPYSDGGATPTYHDWNTGLADTSVAAFIADPINRQHYWSFPAATKWQNDSSGGHSQSLTSFIDFAKLHGKPFAMPETGAGNSNGATDVSDDAAFPQWVAQQLAAAQAAGVKISFVNIWDSNGGGNYEFSFASDGKPAEAAAWAKYLGVPQIGGGRNISALFDTSYYLTQNPDVRAAGVDPLLHFETYGWKEGREPSLVFSDAKYLAANPDVKAAGVNPLLHYLSFGQSEGRMAFLSGGTKAADLLVNATFYDRQLGATLISTSVLGQQQAASSYDNGGWQNGLNPDAFFDTNYYLSHNTDVAVAHINPLLHYEQYGWHEGRNPSAQFSINKYFAANPDVRVAGADPLLHYVQYGQAEGRITFSV